MSEDQWFYEKDGKQHGPISKARLAALIESGELARENLVWKPGEREWSETGSFEFLLPSFKTPPPIPKKAEPETPVPPPLPRPGGTEVHDRESPPTQDADEPLIVRPRGSDLSAKSPDSTKPANVSWPGRLILLIEVIVDQVIRRYREGDASADPQAAVGPGKPPGQLPAGGTKTRRAWVRALVTLLRHLTGIHPSTIRLVLFAVPFLLAVIVVLIVWGRLQEPPEPGLAPTRLAGTQAPVGYSGPVGQIKIDAYPWAEVTRVVSEERGEIAVPGSMETPLVLLVPPGNYRIELGSQTCSLSVAVEQSRTCSKVIRRLDAAEYYREMGW